MNRARIAATFAARADVNAPEGRRARSGTYQSAVRALGVLAVGVGCGLSAVRADPATCADMRARIEKQMQARGGEHGTLAIVPKNLAGNSRVLGSCENGSQRIVWRPTPAGAAAPASGAASAAR